jgi:hypothetical protein
MFKSMGKYSIFKISSSENDMLANILNAAKILKQNNVKIFNTSQLYFNRKRELFSYFESDCENENLKNTIEKFKFVVSL